jgi:hypothetical protein
MLTRVEAARGAKGWISAQLLKGVDEARHRRRVGLPSRLGGWHNDAAFDETRKQLSGLEEQPQDSVWFEVVEDLD